MVPNNTCIDGPNPLANTLKEKEFDNNSKCKQKCFKIVLNQHSIPSQVKSPTSSQGQLQMKFLSFNYVSQDDTQVQPWVCCLSSMTD